MLEINKIHQGDCLKLMKELKDNSIDVIITSPPYNKIGHAKGKIRKKSKWDMFKRCDITESGYEDFNDNINEEEYQKWQISFLNECYRILKEDGSIFYNHKIRRNNNIITTPMKWILKTKLKLWQQIIWDRGGTTEFNNKYLPPRTEYIYWLTKGIPNANRFNVEKKFQTDIWRFEPERRNYGHPASFPIILPSLCIKLTNKDKQLILDPFMGCGTTAVACKQLNKDFIGIELSRKYIDIANNRLSQQVLSNSSPPVRTSDKKSDTKVEFNTDLKEVQK